MVRIRIINQIRRWQSRGQRVVLATGVFDLLHIEHLRFLKKAKDAGERLIVGIESDRRARSIKGYARPVNNQRIRLEQLHALKAVDAAFTLPQRFNSQSDWEGFMAALKPDTYAVSSNSPYLQNKREVCKKYGIDFQIVRQHNPNYSTSLLITKLLDPHITDHHARYRTAVIPGHGRGKHLGFPTLNLKKPADFPYQHGIYAGYVWVGRRRYQGAFHFGPIPTFNQARTSLEVFLLDRCRDIPQDTVEFQLVRYLRPIKAFPSKIELLSQIHRDVLLAKTVLKTWNIRAISRRSQRLQ